MSRVLENMLSSLDISGTGGRDIALPKAMKNYQSWATDFHIALNCELQSQWSDYLQTAATTYVTGALVNTFSVITEKKAKRKMMDTELKVMALVGVKEDALHNALQEQMKKARLD